MRTLSRLGLGVVLLAPATLPAQSAGGSRIAVHALLGAFVPTVDHRSVVWDAFAIGAQVGVGLRPSLAVVGGALISQTAYRDGTRDDVTLVQYDLGLELAPGAAAGTHRRVVPFLGAGAGVRSYDRASGRDGASGQRYFATGYASAGGELALGRVGLRVEARDYVSQSETRGMMAGVRSDDMAGVRNDVTAVAGLAYHFR